MVANVDQSPELEDMTYTDSGQKSQDARSAAFGAIVAGRRTFDLAKGWGGRHPLGVPVVVVTHQAPPEWPDDGDPFTFVTSGVADAVATAQRIAGDKVVTVCGPDVMRQCLEQDLRSRHRPRADHPGADPPAG